MDVIMRDLSVTELFVQDNMARVATHALFRALATQMQGAVPDILPRSSLPDTVRIERSSDPDESHVLLDGGILVRANTRTGSVVEVFPLGWSPASVFISSHVIDRGSTGSALLWFGHHARLLWTCAWGPFHDMWSSIKNAANKTGKGKWWKLIVRFSSICNLNHGPFRSGAWGKGKQTALTVYCETHTHTAASSAFRVWWVAYVQGPKLDYMGGVWWLV